MFQFVPLCIHRHPIFPNQLEATMSSSMSSSDLSASAAAQRLSPRASTDDDLDEDDVPHWVTADTAASLGEDHYTQMDLTALLYKDGYTMAQGFGPLTGLALLPTSDIPKV